MFSATFSEEIKKLASKILKKPILIEAAKQNSVSDLVTHVVYPIESIKKQELLAFLIKQRDLQQVLVFTRTKQNADNLAQQLNYRDISSAALHGDRNQLQRTQALDSFKQGSIRVLVATDVAARGLDIEELAYVINFELPNNPEDYVHRIGRTGRAGALGFAISLVSKEESNLLKGIEELLKTKIKIEEIKEFKSKNLPSKSLNKDAPIQEKKLKQTLSSRNKKMVSSAKNEKTTIRYNSEIAFKNTKSLKNADPLFTESYVPKFSDVRSTGKDELSQRIELYKRLKQPSKPLPALFILPVNSKQK
jgi:ATP-dependent RNA helicase RhlE